MHIYSWKQRNMYEPQCEGYVLRLSDKPQVWMGAYVCTCVCLGCIKWSVQVGVGLCRLLGHHYLLATVWGGAVQSVNQQTETMRRRREWSLGSGDKWPIQRWRTQLPEACVTCKDTWLPPQGESARHTLSRGAECVYVTYDLHHNRLQDNLCLREKRRL